MAQWLPIWHMAGSLNQSLIIAEVRCCCDALQAVPACLEVEQQSDESVGGDTFACAYGYLMVLSFDPETTVASSGVIATHVTCSVCPVNVLLHLKFPRPHTLCTWTQSRHQCQCIGKVAGGSTKGWATSPITMLAAAVGAW